MNRINSNFNLGFDLVLEDFRFEAASIRLAIADLCKGLGHAGPVILFGCNVTYAGTTATVTEGAIFYNDEIWHVYNHTFAVPDPLVGNPQWCFVASWDPEGVKLDSELNSHNTYEVRKAIGALTSIPFPADTVNMSDVIRIDNNYSTTILPLESGVTALNGSSLCVKTGKMVMLEVGVRANLSAGTSTLIATVPEGLRPSKTIRGLCLIRASSATAKNLAAWSITADGNVYIEKLNDETGTWDIYFSTEQFRIS